MKLKLLYTLLFVALVLCQNISAIPVDDSDEEFSLDPIIFTKPKVVQTSTTSTEKPADCECVLFYLCTNKTVNTNGQDLLEVRLNERQKCANLYEICCPTKPTESNVNRTPGNKHSVAFVQNAKKCGTRNVDGVGFRIFGNTQNEAQFGEFPWMAGLFIDDPTIPSHELKFFCGASLIHPQVVMTGAVCVSNTPNRLFKIRVGEWDLGTTHEILDHQDMEIKKIVVHEHFKLYDNDIALVILKEPVNITDNVDTICLPEALTNFDNEQCVVTGWGKTVEGKLVKILKKLDIPIVSRANCLKMLQSARKTLVLKDNIICAGGNENEDSCNGDGGGPLFCPIKGEKNRYQQVGIVSHGFGCGTTNVPAFYTDVSKYRKWIERQMKLENLVL